ncbi:hypothetical protein [Xenorhabdus bovienii]|uniref:Uncharacterized protein n=2 Tax=Xenorhabdus bovienii TaxID=40576 RepID=A0A077PZ31_XENBV|nr:hypothetical protein [Xenorhabdus bovienii]CDH02775.1 hypothetical protein XBFM1_370003 [Xenorhabdus bovienii str. feltiae Moldova]CDH25049.1 hypothetical protein XBKB1_3560010 [Xenorhabdus bovienii str. kraussei Becker Underwood]
MSGTFKSVILNMIDECHDSLKRLDEDKFYMDEEDQKVWIPAVKKYRAFRQAGNR